MAQDKITIAVLFGENEELHTITVSHEQYERILNGDQEILQKLITEESENSSIDMIKETCNEDNEDFKSLHVGESIKSSDGKETYIWSEKAVMLLLELYRERENEFNTGKRHNKIWSGIASELQKSNYSVSGVQVQNKMSCLKRTYKKIKDSNAKSGNHNSSWAFYSTMDSLFGDKTWVSPPAVASSDGPVPPSKLTSSASSSTSSSECHILSASPFEDNSESQSSTFPQVKKRKVEIILDSFIISDLKNDRDQIKEEKKREQLEKEKRKEQMLEIKRAEKREMHRETTEVQRSLVSLLSKLIENQNETN